MHGLFSGSITSLLTLQVEFICRFGDPNEDIDVFEDDDDSTSIHHGMMTVRLFMVPLPPLVREN